MAGAAKYTKPALRERLKKKIQVESKGGRAGQWSARKAQLLAAEYKRQGGGYRGGKKSAQKHLVSWTSEKWQTSDGKKAERKVRGKSETARYLPEKAWKNLSPAKRAATDRKKRAGSRTGRQFVNNTKAAASAGRRARKTK